MHWLSKTHRLATPGQVTITAAPLNPEQSSYSTDQLAPWFTCFNQRGLPVTWAVASEAGTFPLAEQLVASSVPHELALYSPSLPQGDAWEKPMALARQINLPLRTVVGNKTEIDSRALSPFGVHCVVALDRQVPASQTGSPLAMGWNVWEMPITQSLDPSHQIFHVTRRLARLYLAARTSVRTNYVVDLSKIGNIQGPKPGLLRFLDFVSDYASRGMVKLETVGQVTARLSEQFRAAA